MIRCLKCILFFNLILGYNTLDAQISYYIGIESGYYRSNGSFGVNDNILLRLNSQLKYIYKTEKSEAYIQLEANPQFYGISNSVSVVKLKADVSYAQKFNSFNWGIDLLKRNYFYSSETDHSVFDIYYLQSTFNWRMTESLPIQSIIGFAYQDIDNDIDQKADLIFLDNKLFHQFDLYSQFNYGFYIERYVITNVGKNTGWRLGPQIGFNHLKNFILKVDYRFLTHISNITTDFPYEHWLRLVTGKLLDDKWSFFLMADYNLRKINTELTNSKPAYSLIDSENHIYIKIAYELSPSAELSLRAGYFNENYLINDALLRGWHLTFGIKYNN